MPWNSGLLWCWWWQIGLPWFARLNEYNIHLRSGSRRLLIGYKRQAISLVTGRYRHNNFWRGRRR